MKQVSFKPIFILLVFITVFMIMAVAPYLYSISMSEKIDVQNTNLVKLQLLQKTLIADLKRNKEKMQQYGKQKRFLLKGTTLGIAGANLQRRVAEVIKRNNGNARSFQIQSPEKETGLTKIVINISLSADIVSVQKILHELETGTPFIFIDDMVVQSTETQTGSSTSFQRKKLDISMKTIGYFAQEKSI